MSSHAWESILVLLMLAACGLPGWLTGPPSLLDELRVAAADEPRLVQCLLSHFSRPRRERLMEAAYRGAVARGHEFTGVEAYEVALGRALSQWRKLAPERAGSRAEANRAFCVAAGDHQEGEAARALLARDRSFEGDLRQLWLTALGVNPSPDGVAGKILRTYVSCLGKGRAHRELGSAWGPLAEEADAEHSEWRALTRFLDAAADLEGFLEGDGIGSGLVRSIRVARTPAGDVVFIDERLECGHSLFGRAAGPDENAAWYLPADGGAWPLLLDPVPELQRTQIESARGVGDEILVRTGVGERRYQVRDVEIVSCTFEPEGEWPWLFHAEDPPPERPVSPWESIR